MSTYLNCWEHEKCGREPYGDKVKELGVCPASTEKKLDGVHGGKNAGRACWVVAGTFCHGGVQGVFAQKYNSCRDCSFYRKVQEENFHNFEFTVSLMQRLRRAG